MFPLCNVQDATTVNDAVTEAQSGGPLSLRGSRAEQSRAEQSRAEQSKVAELLSPENAKS